MKTLLSRAATVLLALAAAAAAAQAAPEPPRLVVVIAVDQMRSDYVDWYGANWKRGLRKLYDQGANLTSARYPYLSTVTCPGHATIGTGSYPRTHGMILNTWYDRERKKVIECTDDPESPLLGYAPARFSGGDSARNLMAPTLGDEMQAQLGGKTRVVGLSMKARSAIDIAGHKPDVVLWFESSTWVTSTAFTRTLTPWVEKWVRENPVSAVLETPWTRMLPDSAYKFADDAVGEKPPSGWTRVFPHPLKSSSSFFRPGSSSSGRFASSPAADDFLGRLARAAVIEMKLGQGETPDYLGVSFSMTDIVGHQFGPRSHEVQDVLARLDRTIGDLLDELDARVGKDRYVVALSADHGVALIPEQAKAEGRDAGRISSTEIKKRTNEAIAAELGSGTHAVEVQGNDLYLAPGVHAQLSAKPGAVTRVLAAVRQVPGVADAFDASEIRDPAKAKDAVRRAAALGYYHGRSGDLTIVPRAEWIMGSTIAANHGTTHDYDQRVPLLFFGKGIKPGKYDRPASPADLAPTLGALVGVKMPKAEGTVLADVIATSEPDRTEQAPQAGKPEKAARQARSPKSKRK